MFLVLFEGDIAGFREIVQNVFIFLMQKFHNVIR